MLRRIAIRAAAVAAAAAMLVVGPVVLAADLVEIGYVDQGQIGALPAFRAANKQIADFGSELQKQYLARARNASQSEQQRLAGEFQSKMAEKQRQVLGPLFN